MMRIAPLVLACLVACGGAPAPVAPQPRDPFARYTKTSDQRFGPPVEVSQARPWEVGQWAAYRRQRGDEASLEVLQLIAIDGCGFWFDYTSDSGRRQFILRFCVSAVPAPDDARLFELLWAVIERSGGSAVAVHDYRQTSADRTGYAWLVSLVQASWLAAGDAAREDIVTRAGIFEGAIKHTSTTGETRWSHPAIMFGGVVRATSPGNERILIGQEHAKPVPILDVAHDEVHRRGR